LVLLVELLRLRVDQCVVCIVLRVSLCFPIP